MQICFIKNLFIYKSVEDLSSADKNIQYNTAYSRNFYVERFITVMKKTTLVFAY